MSAVPSPPERCHDCGCEGDATEFVRRRIQQPKRTGKGKVFLNVPLCPTCAERYNEVARVGGSRCDRCGARVAPGQGHVRTVTDTEVGGAVAWHRTVQVFLCPSCAESYDDTAGGLIKGMLILVGILLALACVGWVFFPR